MVYITNKSGISEKIDRKLAWELRLRRKTPATSSLRVCSLHFKKDDFLLPDVEHKRARLRIDAIPSCNLPMRLNEKTIKAEVDLRKRRYAKRLERIQPEVEASIVEIPTTSSEGLYTKECIAAEALLSLVNFKKQYTDKAVQVQSGDLLIPFIKIIDTPSKLNSLTGLCSFQLLDVIVQQVEKYFPAQKMQKISMKERVVITFMKLKLGVRYVVLAALVGTIASKTCSVIFKDTINKLACVLKPIIIWPANENCLKNIPYSFEHFKNARVVLDCTEFIVQKPKCLCCRVRTYSHYKGNLTVKLMTAVSPAGLITFISKAYGGRCSDKSIFEQSEIINKLTPGDTIMVDRGFMIDEVCKSNYINVIRPPFLKHRSQFTEEEALLTAQIARARVHIERSNQRIKVFEIFMKPLPWNLTPFIDDIFTVVCAIVNLSSPILSADKFLD